MFINIIFSI